VSLSIHIEKLMAVGKYHFVLDDLATETNCSLPSLRVAASRLARKHRIKMIRSGFGVIYPTVGNEPHPSYYIDALMSFLGARYYVGLLTAAAYWGASHQSTMVYQIYSDRRLRDIKFDKMRIEFITKTGEFIDSGITKVAGIGGYYLISRPELTAIDMIQAPKRSGHLNNIATILDDLVEKWDHKRIVALCKAPSTPTVSIQRIGYLLEILEFEKQASYLEQALAKRQPARALLSPSENSVEIPKNNKSNYQFNPRWNLYINAKVEAD